MTRHLKKLLYPENTRYTRINTSPEKRRWSMTMSRFNRIFPSDKKTFPKNASNLLNRVASTWQKKSETSPSNEKEGKISVHRHIVLYNSVKQSIAQLVTCSTYQAKSSRHIWVRVFADFKNIRAMCNIRHGACRWYWRHGARDIMRMKKLYRSSIIGAKDRLCGDQARARSISEHRIRQMRWHWVPLLSNTRARHMLACDIGIWRFCGKTHALSIRFFFLTLKCWIRVVQNFSILVYASSVILSLETVTSRRTSWYRQRLKIWGSLLITRQ